jgi:sugar phosphate isomerase/epimerase
MEISGYSSSFARQLTSGELDTVATIHIHRELGLRAVELVDPFITDEEIPRIQVALAETGCRVCCYDVLAGFNSVDPAARQRDADHLRTGLRRAARLRAPKVLAIPGRLNGGVSPDEIRHWFADGLRACLSMAAELGLTLMIPNLGTLAAILGRSEHLLGVCEAVGPELGVTYDGGNYLLACEDPLAALDRVASRVAHVHFKDWRALRPNPTQVDGDYVGLDGGVFRGVALGEGIVDLRGALARLRQLGYQGCITVEYEGLGDPRQHVDRGIAYLRALLAAPTAAI